jgi:hypothetical protein
MGITRGFHKGLGCGDGNCDMAMFPIGAKRPIAAVARSRSVLIGCCFARGKARDCGLFRLTSPSRHPHRYPELMASLAMLSRTSVSGTDQALVVESNVTVGHGSELWPLFDIGTSGWLSVRLFGRGTAGSRRASGAALLDPDGRHDRIGVCRLHARLSRHLSAWRGLDHFDPTQSDDG